ncbi:MAG TPA: preprotein translocase subunit SecE [Caulobacteraceae bacterium]|jgi:preprotein translocase subunit SecE|nr:preprotein translocase subunit SecE [Caulobacteraceae bacterium]
MAKDQGIIQTAMRRRTPFKAPAGAAAPAEERRRPFNPIQFLREVDAERKKVTWTSWKETWITSVMVAIMVVITAIFFFGVDTGLGFLLGQILKLANAG